MIDSALAGFYRLDPWQRRALVADTIGLSETDVAAFEPDGGLTAEQANHMAENVLGIFGLPLGLCVNLRIDGRDRLVPMAIEEPSVVAAASHAAKMLRAGGGVRTTVAPSHMVGQIQLLDVDDGERARQTILAARDRLIALANAHHPRLLAVGGGAFDVQVHELPPRGHDDPLGTMWIVHLVVDVRDAMGANTINTMCERLAPEIAALTGARVGLRILSNLADRRTVVAEGCVPFDALVPGDLAAGRLLASRIVEASVFAERDPYRAATHNKGIMNGVDAALIALGQDWRAVEAGAHAYAARDGHYGAMATWRMREGALHGRLEIPMAVGTVGGVVDVHPAVRVLRRIAEIETSAELASCAAAVGLAQNLGAIRALAGEGIQRGHMRLHARNLAVQAGAVGTEVERVADAIARRGSVSIGEARAAIASQSGQYASSRPDLDALARVHVPQVLALLDEVAASTIPDHSPLHAMIRYHMETGGKRLRAVLPLGVACTFGVEPERLLPFAAACEVLHNATLVHDDIQDGDATRRGRPTAWAQFGRARAIDLGDALFYIAVLLVQRMRLPAGQREALTQRLLRETLRVLDGQEREMVLRETDTPTIADYFRMVEAKTSGLFALPLAGAAQACGAKEAIVRELAEAARHVGVLFQVQDDLLDLYGDKGRESRGSDIAEGKRSILVVQALRVATSSDRHSLLSILDAPRPDTTEADVTKAIAILERNGAADYALRVIHERRERALALPALREHAPVHRLLEEMCERFVDPIRPLLETTRRAS